MNWLKLKNRQGSVLLATVIITFLVLAAIVQFCSWVNQATRTNVRQVARQKALLNADAGVQAAFQFLRSPQAVLVTTAPYTLLSVNEGTTFYLMLKRKLTDTSLIDIYSTGYYQLKDGTMANAQGDQGQLASIRAQIQLRNVGDYFAAVPGTLEIGYGSNISSGIIYGKTLDFKTGSGNPKTKVKAASYFTSITPANYSNYVTFLTPGQPTQLSIEPNLPMLDDVIRNQYQGMANTDVLSAGSTLTNVTPPSNLYKVYYSPGDIHLGAVGSSCTLTSSLLIYSQGDIYIDNIVNSQTGGTNWPALMTEGNIIISGLAPNVMTINATMVANGEIKAVGPARNNGVLTVKGGMVAGGGISFGNVYKQQRNYSYQAPDTALPLPFTTVITSYKVTGGKYNQ